MTGFRRRLVALVSAVVILMAVVVLPGCKKAAEKPVPEPNKTTAPAAPK